MVRKLITFSAIVFLFFQGKNGYGQYTITAYPPSGNNVALEHLWHLMIAGQIDPIYTQYYIALRVFNDQNSLIIKSNSATFSMPTLPVYINYTDVSLLAPINTTLYDNFYSDVVNSGGFFPPGTYHVIMTLYGRPTDGEFVELSQSEYDFIIEALYPPVLIFPCGETITTVYPTFTWTPAYISSTQTILYCLRLVEIYNGQTAYQAIMSNPSYYEECNIPVTMLNYPPNSNSILPDQPYAWQVTATINGLPVASSNVCEFIYHLPDTLPIPDTTLIYGILNADTDGGYYFAANEKLHFIYYYDAYTDGVGIPLQFNIYDPEDNTKVKGTGDNVVYGPTVVKFGENRYTFELNECGLNLTADKYYILEVIDPKNFKYYLRFFSAQSLTSNPCE
jgi:hypothetical protein